MKELRRYEHLAHREHWCDACCRYILPGDFYEGIVYATQNNGIVVFKQHKNPCCDFPTDPDEIHKTCEEKIEKTLRSAA